MSYHEYQDRNGNIIHRHYNGHRFTRNFSDLNIRTDEDVALEVLQDLVDLIDTEAYTAWWEATFEQNGHTAEDYTWAEIKQAAQRKIDTAKIQPEDSLLFDQIWGG